MKKKTSLPIFLLALVMLANALGYGTIIPLLYPYAAKFGLNDFQTGMLFVAFSLAQFVATPIMGRMSDKYGRKPLLVISMLGSALSFIVFALAKNVHTLFAARILDGITGGNVSVANAAISDIYDNDQDRTKAFAMLGATFGVGFLVGPALGGLASAYSMELPFFIAAGFCALSSLLSATLLKETHTKHDKQETTSFLGLTQLLFKPATSPILIATYLIITGQSMFYLLFQSISTHFFSVTVQEMGFFFTALGLVSILVQGFGIRIFLKKVHEKRKLFLLLVTSTIVFLILVSLTTTRNYFNLYTLLYFSLFSSQGAVLVSWLSQRVKKDDYGATLGMNQSMTSLGQVTGPFLAGMILQKYGQSPWIVLGVVTIFAAAALVIFPLHEKQEKIDIQ
jgi:multidrug resistance protein